jgi:hypothetical protein
VVVVLVGRATKKRPQTVVVQVVVAVVVVVVVMGTVAAVGKNAVSKNDGKGRCGATNRTTLIP